MTATLATTRRTWLHLVLTLLMAGSLLTPFVAALPVSAQGTATNTPSAATAPPPRTSLVNPLGRGVTLRTLIGRITRMIMGVSGSFALLMFVYGAFVWVTSAGNMDKVQKGKKIFTWATIGIAVIFGSYVLVSIVFKALSG